jgi:S1-C subfamily serine protease
VQVLTPPLAERLKLTGRTGVLVTRVIDDTSGLKAGDVILAIDGEPVTATNPGDEEVFAAAVRRYRIGMTLPLTVSRGGSELTLPVKLSASPKPPREMAHYPDPDFEFVARDLTEADRDGQKVPGSTRGVMVEDVSRGGWADLAQLEQGDIILSVDAKPVVTVAELEAAMKEIASRKPAHVILHVRRGVRTRFIELQPSWK